MARHGENIRKRIDGRWEGRYKVFDERREKYVYRSVYGRDYEEAKEKLSIAKFDSACQGTEEKTESEMERVDRERVSAKKNGILFSHASEEWLSDVSRNKKYSTHIKYDTIYRIHLADVVGQCHLSSYAAQELKKKIFDHLSEADLSESLQKSVICVVNQILAFADKHYQTGIPLLERPPAKVKKKSVVTFSRAEQAALLGRIYRRMDKFKATLLLCLYTGLRLGELCALKWTDIDFVGRTLTVNRTVQRIAVPGHMTKTILLESNPKSESSRRTIPLTSELLEILSRLKKEQPYVFGEEQPLEPRTMQYHFKKVLDEAKIEGRTFHTLRHPYVKPKTKKYENFFGECRRHTLQANGRPLLMPCWAWV